MSRPDDSGAPRPELDAEIEVCGEVYFFRRSLGLMRRIEQRFGAVYALAKRLDEFGATTSELSGIIDEVTRGADDRPSRADVERWLFRVGILGISRSLAKVLYEMTLGSDKLAAAADARRLANEDTADPTPPAGETTHPPAA